MFMADILEFEKIGTNNIQNSRIYDKYMMAFRPIHVIIVDAA